VPHGPNALRARKKKKRLAPKSPPRKRSRRKLPRLRVEAV
jgi:hypothetical protein